MAQIVLITNAWGARHGGINSFNTDFAKALSGVLAPNTRVTCVVMYATAEDTEDAAKAGVRLLSLGAKDSERVDESRAVNVLDAVQNVDSGEVLWWVGHDVISGDAAVALPKKAGQGKAAVIHHMSYVDYATYKQGKASITKEKREQQRRIFKQADMVFGVGPLLRDSLADLISDSKKAMMLVPGLAEIEPAPSPKRFSAITFGRLDPENDRIKQGRLAIAGFATACRKAHEDEVYPEALRENPRLFVIGVSPSGDEEKELLALAQQKAGRVISLHPLPYEEDRTELFDELRCSSIAMMLSWHEGFGLTGWEAIAAEVPLIVSRESGLYKLIDEKLGNSGTACLKVVNVRGQLGDLADNDAANFDPKDEADVSKAILELAAKLDRWKQSAKELRTRLSEKSGGYTWANAARSFADALGLPNQAEISSALLSATSFGQSSPTSTSPSAQATLATEPSSIEQPLLELRKPSWDPERGHPESQLLRPEEFCVPFHNSRRQILDGVLTWATATDGLPAELQFRIGSAGAGKTRLMLEVCRELQSRGWSAGFLASNLNPHQTLEKQFKEFLAANSRTFVVVDYAETRRREVIELINAASVVSKSHRVRIMLLARDAGEWWDRLPTDYPSLESFLTGRAVSGPHRIPEVPPGEQSRETIFREALTAFSSRLGKSPQGILIPDLSAPHFANVLFIHLAAMAALSGEHPGTATSLLEATLRRERRYWHEAARAQGIPSTLEPGLDQAVAMFTLKAGAKNAAEARRLLQTVPRLRGTRIDEIDRVLNVLRTFYPVAGGVDALRPDILGEQLVSQELAKDDSPLETLLGKSADEPIRRSALTVLNRLARHSPSNIIWLHRGLQQHLALCASVAVTVAIESGDPIGKVLAEVLEKAPSSETWDLVEPLRSKMPLDTTALRECALILVQLRIKRLNPKGKLVGSKQKAKLADVYLDLGIRYAALGEDREALNAYRKARDLFQDLGKSTPEHLANVATCLTNESNRLKALGSFKDALERQQEGVKILRKLDASYPGSYQVALARSLMALSTKLGALGRAEEAYRAADESLSIYRSLEETDPEWFSREVAQALVNFAAGLSDLGRYDEALLRAQESYALTLESAEVNPDAFEPFLADTLIVLTMHLRALGRYKEARETGERAVALARKFASSRPTAFRPLLGRALGILASVITMSGQPQEALGLAFESLGIQTERAGKEPAAALDDLANEHSAVAWVLSELERYQEALPHAEEGLAIFRKQLQVRPEVIRSALVASSSLLAHLLVMLGRLPEARDLLVSDKSQFEALRESGRTQDVIIPCADFSMVLALIQLRLDEFKDSLENSLMATELFEENLRALPLTFRVGASEAWCTRASCEAALGTVENAQRSAARGLEILQADLVDTSRQLSPWMVGVARDLIRLAGPLASPTAHAAVYNAAKERGANSATPLN